MTTSERSTAMTESEAWVATLRQDPESTRIINEMDGKGWTLSLGQWPSGLFEARFANGEKKNYGNGRTPAAAVGAAATASKAT